MPGEISNAQESRNRMLASRRRFLFIHSTFVHLVGFPPRMRVPLITLISAGILDVSKVESQFLESKGGEREFPRNHNLPFPRDVTVNRGRCPGPLIVSSERGRVWLYRYHLPGQMFRVAGTFRQIEGAGCRHAVSFRSLFGN